jgi:hypothetical protein
MKRVSAILEVKTEWYIFGTIWKVANRELRKNWSTDSMLTKDEWPLFSGWGPIYLLQVVLMDA